MAIRLHQENPRLFLEAIRFTAAETGFIPRLIEKDYFCSVVLEDLAILNSPLTFKGGTLLAKVHSGFYRLSEDLDFSISTPPGSTKNSRSQAVAPIKTAINNLAERLHPTHPEPLNDPERDELFHVLTEPGQHRAHHEQHDADLQQHLLVEQIRELPPQRRAGGGRQQHRRDDPRVLGLRAFELGQDRRESIRDDGGAEDRDEQRHPDAGQLACCQGSGKQQRCCNDARHGL